MGGRLSRSTQGEEDGSRQEQGPRAGQLCISYHYEPTLLTDSCPLLEQPTVTLERILALLTVPELSRVASTCTDQHTAVAEFVRHQCSADRLTEALRDFMALNGELLTESEVKDFGGLEGWQDVMLQYRLLSLREKYWQVYRTSCCDPAVWVPHRENSTYYRVRPTRPSELQGRNLLELTTVCWLQVKYFSGNVSVLYSCRISRPLKTRLG